MILDRNTLLVKEVLSEISPSPLTVVAITQCTVAHRTVSYQEEHGIIALTASARLDTRRPHLVERVKSQVSHLVQILHGFGHLRQHRQTTTQKCQKKEYFFKFHFENADFVISL